MALDELKWHGLEHGLKSGVVDVFRPWQPAQPLMGTIASQVVQIHDDHLVGCFYLAMRLRVECRHHVELDSSEAQQLFLEDGGEHGVPVRDNGLRNAV